MSTQGMGTHESNDWMQLEPDLVALVRAAVQDLRPAVHVLTAAELADVKEQAQLTPAVHVIYGGFRITGGQRTAWQLTHTWYAVAAVRNVATVRSGQAARAQAGTLAARVLAALASAQVPGAIEPLEPATPPPARYAAGFQYVPVAVQAITVFKKPLV